jgi:hypothetical protein
MDFPFRQVILGLALASAATGCADSRTTATAGIGRPCDHDDDCEHGQACIVTSTTPDGTELTTCQIPCSSTYDCPDDFVCRGGTQDAPTAICVEP